MNERMGSAEGIKEGVASFNDQVWVKVTDEGERVYFVHGYYVETGSDTIAVTDYGGKFSAGVSRGNFHAIQFHPEKSGDVGAHILENFLNI